jgi:nucleoside-diphosphate-sugar epimerase
MAERTFLITGATGFLGGAVAVAALRAGYGPKLRLLVRGSAQGTPAMRLFSNLRRLGATEGELSSLGQDFMLEADLGRKGCIRRASVSKTRGASDSCCRIAHVLT